MYQYPGAPPQVDPAVQGWFMQVDRDRSGFIDAQELQQALGLGNLNFSTAMCAQMIRLHDRNMSGKLDLQQFAQLHYFLVRMQQLFMTLDQDRNGRLSRPEFANALQTAGYKLDAPVLDRVGQTFDPARSGSWGLAEWLACTVFLESAQATFKAFDPQGAGRVNMDLQQFIYASSHTR